MPMNSRNYFYIAELKSFLQNFEPIATISGSLFVVVPLCVSQICSFIRIIPTTL